MFVAVPVLRGITPRNSGVLHRKYSLNPMLAPQFELSLALRGSMELSAEELNIIFDPGVGEEPFRAMRRRLLSRVMAPFRQGDDQVSLWGA